MKSEPKIYLANAKGEHPKSLANVTLESYMLFANKGDHIDILGNHHVVLRKDYKFVGNNDYSVTVVYE